MLYLRFAVEIEVWLVQKGIIWQIAASIVLPLGLVILNPEGTRYASNAGSVLLGFAPGIILERRWVRFRSGGSLFTQSLRFVLWAVVVAIVLVSGYFTLQNGSLTYLIGGAIGQECDIFQIFAMPGDGAPCMIWYINQCPGVVVD